MKMQRELVNHGMTVDKKVNCAKTKNSRSFVIVCWDMIPYLLQLLKDDDWVKK